ncbi:hypothetical protein AB4077_14450 [Vibrio cyclitrophicus]|uniref:hypothetical protein n=1 Tax=Vibrio cyclitrophicus TaxID=47951 RepID=UPI000C829E0A|nr:hypothetical protein [Vibrio cyclitrophicus]MCC4775885.1 hypothetical protein [Vibrio cyclitrophicus]MCC4843684.1 hypothetical protein [Vibrio cyclitrophicus]PME08842.1 hypothetical protein BCV42_11275 [Vibrio cyclitrophicus]PME58320.1 hypothetical protein BCV37_00340 [Vibrio cyclitrophicus]PME80111.1 hypothetical protein BCV28_05105 [Vibrio cyclitrophicus]
MENTKNSKKNAHSVNKEVLLYISILTTLVIISIVGFYIYNFKELSISPDPEKWGPFGDFFGGVLNPILAFISFLALLYTIHMQQMELSLTRTELERSVSAQQDTASFAKSQNEITIEQIKRIESNEKKNDIYKLIGSIENKVSSVLSSEVRSYRTNNDITLEKVFYFINRDIDKGGLTKDKVFDIRDEYKIQLDNLETQLSELDRLIDCFTEISGHELLKEYYEKTYCLDRKVIEYIKGN